MLCSALINSLEQVYLIVDTLKKLPASQGAYLYREKGVGRHIRHITDHFLAVQSGLEAGLIDYNRRQRGGAVERDWRAASVFLANIVLWFQDLEGLDREIKVLSEIDCRQMVNQSFISTLARELLYLINHTIHHVAYIKLLLRGEGIDLPDYIGIAPGTASFLRGKAH